MSSEETVLELIKFVSETGRLPKINEPGLEDLIDSAIKHFGSLEEALRIAGLLSSNLTAERTIRTKRAHLRSSQASKTSVWSTYPKDYFLNFLGFNRSSVDKLPGRSGTPSWWERRANTQYTCSICKETIGKGERYIGRKILRPGRRGIYGYKGTYFTDYYHVICLLRVTKAKAEENIRGISSEINDIKEQIDDFTEKISSKREQIVVCQSIMQEARLDYERSSFWRKVAKWFMFNYLLWSKNREITRFEKEIAKIENREIPERKAQINNLEGKAKNLKYHLNEIDKRIQELLPKLQS